MARHEADGDQIRALNESAKAHTPGFDRELLSLSESHHNANAQHRGTIADLSSAWHGLVNGPSDYRVSTLCNKALGCLRVALDSTSFRTCRLSP